MVSITKRCIDCKLKFISKNIYAERCTKCHNSLNGITINKIVSNDLVKEEKPFLTLDPVKIYSTPTREIICRGCDCRLFSNNSGRKYCSSRCREEHYALMYKRNTKQNCIDKKCKRCSSSFSTYNPAQVFCSKDCRKNFYESQKLRNTGLEHKQCPICKKMFKPKCKTHTYCTSTCLKIEYERRSAAHKQEHKEKAYPKTSNCKACNAEYIMVSSNNRYCSINCRNKIAELKITSKKPSDLRVGIQSNILLEGLRLCNEQEFADWFDNNYILFGIKKIIKHDVFFPDVVAEMCNGIILRIELEYFAANFKRHGHDSNTCDLIISYASSKNQDRVCGIPVISLFHFKNNSVLYSEVDHRRKVITRYLSSLIERMNNQIETFMTDSKISGCMSDLYKRTQTN